MPLNDAAVNVLGNAAADFPGAIQSGQDFSNQLVNFFLSERNYRRGRRDSLADWNRVNEYNSPAAMRQRLIDAHYNPALMYGSGGSGGSAPPVNTPDVPVFNFREPSSNGANPNHMANMLGMADLEIKKAQADNLRVQNDVIKQDALLRAWQAQRAGFDFAFATDMRDVSADALREEVRQKRTTTDVMIDRNAREAALNASNIQEAASRMLTYAEQRKAMPLERGRIRADTDRLRKQIDLMIQDGTLKEMDIRLREKGINPSDPLWSRYVGMFLSDIYEGRVTAGDIGTSLWKWLFD